MTKNRLQIFLLAFMLSFCLVANSQTAFQKDETLDSLYKVTYKLVFGYEYSKAIIKSRELIEKAQQKDNNYYTIFGYTRLGQIYISIKDTVNSNENYRKALEYANITKNDTIIASVYNDLGNAIMINGGDANKARINFEKSLYYNKKGDRSDIGIFVNNINLAWAYISLGQEQQALPYLNYCRIEIEQNTNYHPLYKINVDLLSGRYHLSVKKNLDHAIVLLQKASREANKGNFIEEASQAQKYLTIAFETKGDLKNALASVKKESEFRTEHEKLIRRQQIAETTSKYNLIEYQKDAEIAKKEQLLSETLVSKEKGRSRLYLVISLILLAALLSVFFLYRSRRKFVKRLRVKNKELTEAKENAERLSNLKSQFFSTVSHELRTPLYGVIGLSSILLEDEKLKNHKEDLKSLKFSADYLLALINDVLTLNKADANGMKLEKVPFQLTNLITNITKSFAFSLQQNNNKIIVNLDEKLPNNLIGDSIKLSQILMNLVGNAVKFNENGLIEITIQLLDETKKGLYKTKFIIKDNGIGIPLEKQQTIFEEFSQLESNNFNYQGTGLGLPIVKKLLNVFGSKIELDSSPGNGATFSFIIDLEKSKNANMRIVYGSGVALPITSDFEDFHILIVDDNKINQKVTQRILDARNFKTTLADDGLEAIEYVQKQNFSLILMDVHMPNMGGVEAAKKIRAYNKTIPIIALTAVEIEEARAEITDSGINDIILKPYDVAQFITTILQHLNNTHEA